MSTSSFTLNWAFLFFFPEVHVFNVGFGKVIYLHSYTFSHAFFASKRRKHIFLLQNRHPVPHMFLEALLCRIYFGMNKSFANMSGQYFIDHQCFLHKHIFSLVSPENAFPGCSLWCLFLFLFHILIYQHTQICSSLIVNDLVLVLIWAAANIFLDHVSTLSKIFWIPAYSLALLLPY